MGIRFGSSNPGNNLRVGTETVGGIAIGSEVAYRRFIPPPPVTLYTINRSNTSLYSLNSSTGVARRIGSARRFGVNERDPIDLEFHNGTLYMAGADSGALYTVGTSNGRARRVGRGFGGASPRGLASSGSTLYMSASISSSDYLYTVNTSAGTAVTVGSLEGFGVGEEYPGFLGYHNGTLYMSGGSDNNILYTLSTSTGRATRVGSVTCVGLASDGNNLYGIDGNNIFILNTSTSSVTVTYLSVISVSGNFIGLAY